MSKNDVVILDNILEKRGDSENFNSFVSEQILKNYDLSFDELKLGLTDGADDGGIDGFYTLVNGNLLMEPFEKSLIKKGMQIDLFMIQSKNSVSFSEDFFDKITNTINNIFDLTKDLDKLKSFYNPALLGNARLFRDTLSSLSTVYPQINIIYCYATKGDIKDIHPKINNKATNLKNLTLGYFSGKKVDVKFFGAKELLELARKEKTYNLTLEFVEYFSRSQDDYVVLCSLPSYYKFVTDEGENLKKYILESNVRDYQGNIEVNKDIAKTLTSEEPLDFWWLNNGITILATRAGIAGKKITLEEVQIVNGLQTTNCIYEALKDKKINFSDKFILIKIIISSDQEARDKIIKATNFQTRIPPASLRATDSLQRNIEDYFKKYDWFYDRRKNFYKNLGKSSTKIISIPFLAQSLTSLILKEPHIARSRPSSLVKADNDYQKVFEKDLALEIYLKAAILMRKVDDILRNKTPNYSVPEKTNFRFHIAFAYVLEQLGKTYEKNDLKKIDENKIEKESVNEIIEKVLKSGKIFIEKNNITLDAASKTKIFTDYLIKQL